MYPAIPDAAYSAVASSIPVTTMVALRLSLAICWVMFLTFGLILSMLVMFMVSSSVSPSLFMTFSLWVPFLVTVMWFMLVLAPPSHDMAISGSPMVSSFAVPVMTTSPLVNVVGFWVSVISIAEINLIEMYPFPLLAPPVVVFSCDVSHVTPVALFNAFVPPPEPPVVFPLPSCAL